MYTYERRAITFTSLLVAASLALSGCNATHDATPDSATTDTPTVTDITTETIPKTGGIEWRTWGEPITIDGVTITVNAPESFKPSSTAYPTDVVGATATKTVVKVENGRDTILEGYDVSVTASVMNGVAEPISDALAGIKLTGYAPRLLPTRSQEITLGFAADPDIPDFAVMATVGLTNPTTAWTTK